MGGQKRMDRTIGAKPNGAGANFHTIESKGKLSSQTNKCLCCHGSAFERNILGHLVRSTFPELSRQPIYKVSSLPIHQTTPTRYWRKARLRAGVLPKCMGKLAFHPLPAEQKKRTSAGGADSQTMDTCPMETKSLPPTTISPPSPT